MAGIFDTGIFDTGIFDHDTSIVGKLDVDFAAAFGVAIAGTSIVRGDLGAVFAPPFATAFHGGSVVAGVWASGFTPTLEILFTGDSDGTPIVLPRDTGKGTAYLVEIEAYDPAKQQIVTLNYSSDGFNTRPDDAVPNAWYGERVINPGNFERSMFGSGSTTGVAQVGYGYIELNNNDGRLSDGGADSIYEHAFDGYRVTVRAIDRIGPQYESSVVVFSGTMEQAEFLWEKVSIRIRDRLALLNEPIQENRYAGTTIAGGMDEAEGRPEDLKGQPKPLTFGAPSNVPAVASNVFDHIYDLGDAGLDAVAAVRDQGVLLTSAGADYPSIAALRAASIAPGQWASSLGLGKIRLGSVPVGQVTVAPVVGAAPALRTAGQLARRILLQKGLIENTDFLASDIAALDAANSAEIGYWIGAEEHSALAAISDILNSIGATICPDRLGVLRMYRLDAPAGIPVATITEMEVLESAGNRLERLATGDQGRGVPAWQVIQRYGWNGAVMTPAELAAGALPLTDSFRAFAGQEWRSATAENDDVFAVHKLAPELTFDSWIVDEPAAEAEAARKLELYGVRRDLFRVPAKSYLVEHVDLNHVVRLRLPRFNLNQGKLFRVVGMAENLGTTTTALDLWG